MNRVVFIRACALSCLLSWAPGNGLAQAQATVSAAVQQLVSDWADAWQAGRFDEYASYYTREFRGESASADEWRKLRRGRIDKRTDIRINIGPVLVELNKSDAEIARAVFLQHYQSDVWCDVVEKTLMLTLTESGWRISGESSTPRARC